MHLKVFLLKDGHLHYSDVIWALWRFKLSSTRLFVIQFAQSIMKENIEVACNRLFVLLVVYRHKGPVMPVIWHIIIYFDSLWVSFPDIRCGAIYLVLVGNFPIMDNNSTATWCSCWDQMGYANNLIGRLPPWGFPLSSGCYILRQMGPRNWFR